MLAGHNTFRMLHEGVEFIKMLARKGVTRRFSGQVLLDEYMVGDGEGGIELAEGYKEFDVIPVERVSSSMRKIAVDGTCRRIGCLYSVQFIATAAVCSSNLYPLTDYPPGPWRYYATIPEEYTWIGVIVGAYRHVEEQPPPYMRIFQPIDGEEYDEKQAQTELRQGLETFMLDRLLDPIVKIRDAFGWELCILCDGCIYYVPHQKLFSGEYYRHYGVFYERDILERIRIARSYLNYDIPILGIVKRVEKSHLLVDSMGKPTDLMVGDCLRRYNLPNSGFISDAEMLTRLFAEKANELLSSGRPVLGLMTTPIEIDYSVRTVKASETLRSAFSETSKIVVYMGLLRHPLHPSPIDVFRIETTKWMYDKFGDQLWMEAVSDSLSYLQAFPSSIVNADRRAREWNTILFRYSGALHERYELPLDYDTRRELEESAG